MRLQGRTTLALPNNLSTLRPLLAFVREAAIQVGFTANEVEEIELATEEAVVNIVEHAYDPGEEATFLVAVEQTALGLRLVVHDDGLPLDPERLGLGAGTSKDGLGVGTVLMKRLTDEISFVNRGREGKDVVMTKYLHRPPLEEPAPRFEPPQETPTPRIPFTMRLFEPGDAVEIARCAYRAYGYSYPNPHVFFPEHLIELNAREEIFSAVAVAPDGDIMGHCAAEVPGVGATVAEIGMGFVKPAYRSQGVLKDLTRYLLDICRARGFSGVYVQAVTSHVASQRSALSQGFRECALLVGAYPEDMDFKHLGGKPSSRLSLVVAYQDLVPRTTHPLFPPSRHRAMLERLFANIGGTLLVTDAEPPTLSVGTGEIRVHVAETVNAACIDVLSFAQETQKELLRALHNLCHHRVDFIQFRLPLVHPTTPLATDTLEDAGCFFAGVLPDGVRGELLLLQYLNNVIVDYDAIKTHGEVARELLDYVRACDPNRSELRKGVTP